MRYFRPGFICRPPLAVIWNQQNKTANVDLSGGLLTAIANSSGDGGVMATKFRTTGKFYAEVNGTALGGGDTGIGLASPSVNLTGVGSVAGSALLHFRNGNVYKNGNLQYNSGSISAGVLMRLAYDADAHLAWMAPGSGNWNANPSADPATGVGGQSTSAFDAGGIAPLFAVSVSGDTAILNAGLTSFSFSAPSGFNNWNTS